MAFDDMELEDIMVQVPVINKEGRIKPAQVTWNQYVILNVSRKK